MESGWKSGESLRLMIPDGQVGHRGEVIEIESRRRLVLSWRAEFKPEWHAEGYSRVAFELEPQGEAVKLTVVHEIDKPDSKLVNTLSNDWPQLLCSLKSLLETGESLTETRRWPKGL